MKLKKKIEKFSEQGTAKTKPKPQNKNTKSERERHQEGKQQDGKRTRYI